MINTNRAEMIKVIQKYLIAFPQTKLSKAGIEIYIDALIKRYTPEQVEEALKDLLYNAKFFPTIAEISETIREKHPSKPKPFSEEEHAKEMERERRIAQMIKEQQDEKYKL